MATIFRELSYRYQWLYDAIAKISALAVGGEAKFRRLAIQNLTLTSDTKILDLCCGSGQATSVLVEYSQNVIALDASPLSLKRAQKNVPQAKYVEGFAEAIPLPDEEFDLVHTSAALHEMQPQQLREIINEVYRILKPEGIFTMVDFHTPTPLMMPPIALFFWLFETETAWQFIKTDLPALLTEAGFEICQKNLYTGDSLQVIQARKVK